MAPRSASVLWWVMSVLAISTPPTLEGALYCGEEGRSLLKNDAAVCIEGTCGLNADCTDDGGFAVCACLSGYEGDPISGCKKLECVHPTDCADHLTCNDHRCVDPCEGGCGRNTRCYVKNHVGACECLPQHVGDPLRGCRYKDPNEPCLRNPCGRNAKCEVVNDAAKCTCLPGYFGNGIYGCRRECESDHECSAYQRCANFKCANVCDQCGANAECTLARSHVVACRCPRGYIGDAYTSCKPECTADSQCPAAKPRCLNFKCANPCEGACPPSAECSLRHGRAVCWCPENTIGTPEIACTPIDRSSNANYNYRSRTTSANHLLRYLPTRLEIEEDDDPCRTIDCGPNSRCNVKYDPVRQTTRTMCSCMPGCVQNTSRGCRMVECTSNNDCTNDMACVQHSCVSPCRSARCGYGADCSVRRHVAVCSCPNGSWGDARLACSTPIRLRNRY